ncbi:hypothetical protein FRC02_004548 [Tulasnella sp. 418]|nr:hypothetical protein FRC02_004548 [Tulasnella sp. 418]
MQKESFISPAAGFPSPSVIPPAQSIETLGLPLSRDKPQFLFTTHTFFSNGHVYVAIAFLCPMRLRYVVPSITYRRS